MDGVFFDAMSLLAAALVSRLRFGASAPGTRPGEAGAVGAAEGAPSASTESSRSRSMSSMASHLRV